MCLHKDKKAKFFCNIIEGNIFCSMNSMKCDIMNVNMKELQLTLTSKNGLEY